LLCSYYKRLAHINAMEAEIERLSDVQLRQKTGEEN
jgi:preprotein translocase subunit SecA